MLLLLKPAGPAGGWQDKGQALRPQPRPASPRPTSRAVRAIWPSPSGALGPSCHSLNTSFSHSLHLLRLLSSRHHSSSSNVAASHSSASSLS